MQKEYNKTWVLKEIPLPHQQSQKYFLFFLPFKGIILRS